MVVSLYVTWLTAWAVLGREPRPSLDDPKFISAWVDVPYCATVFMLVGFPIAAVVGILYSAWFGWKQGRIALLLPFVHLASWIGALALLSWDPLAVGNWFMD